MKTLKTNLAYNTASKQILCQPNSHIMLLWNQLQIEMRTADLIVLHQALEQATKFDCNCTLWLEQLTIYLTPKQLDEMRSLVGKL